MGVVLSVIDVRLESIRGKTISKLFIFQKGLKPYPSPSLKMNRELVVPTLDELVDHFRAQANWKGPPPRYWVVESHKNKKEKVEPKIEMVTPLAQEIKRAEAEVKEMIKRGDPLPVDNTIISLEPQRLKKRTKISVARRKYTAPPPGRKQRL